MDVTQSEGNSRPQNLLAEAHCTRRVIGERPFCEIRMEAEEHQQPRKTPFYSELPKVVRIQPQNSGVVANYKDVCVCLFVFHKEK